MTLEIRTSNERHMSADTFLDLSCRVQDIAQDYCVKTGCPAGEGVEALLSAAAHYAVWSHQTSTFTQVADKLSSRITSMIRDNPEFLGLNGSCGPAQSERGPADGEAGTACASSESADSAHLHGAANITAMVSALVAKRRTLMAQSRELGADLGRVNAALKHSIAEFRRHHARMLQGLE